MCSPIPPLSYASRTRLRDALKLLQANIPLPWSVRMEIRKSLPDDNLGLCVMPEAGGAVILVNAQQLEREALDTVAHEYAHAMCLGHAGGDSRAAWGIAYAEAYEVVFGDHTS